MSVSGHPASPDARSWSRRLADQGIDGSTLLLLPALLLMLVSFHLAWSRPKEPMFALLGFNALV